MKPAKPTHHVYVIELAPEEWNNRMSYVDSNLLPEEKVTYRARLHWVVYTKAALGALLSIPVFLIGYPGVGAGILGLAAVVGLVAFVKRGASEFAVTDQRVLIKVGWLQRRSMETLLSKVESIGVDQDLQGRLFGYGTISVVGTGGTRESFKLIGHPLEFRRQVQQQIISGQRAAAPAALQPSDREERDCPYCAERILARAKVCKYCGRDLTPAA